MNAARALISLLFIVAMAWLWYPYFMKSTDDGVAQQDHIATPDYIATGLSQTSYNDQGELSHTVYVGNGAVSRVITHFTKPVFTLYGETENWQVNADEATLYNNNILILENNVTATNLKEGAMIEKVSAEAIQVDIDSQRMESEQAVVLSGPNMKITGQGLKADLNTEIVELTEHTRTIYYDQ